MNAKRAVGISAVFNQLLTNREEVGVNLATGGSWAAEITS